MQTLAFVLVVLGMSYAVLPPERMNNLEKWIWSNRERFERDPRFEGKWCLFVGEPPQESPVRTFTADQYTNADLTFAKEARDPKALIYFSTLGSSFLADADILFTVAPQEEEDVGQDILLHAYEIPGEHPFEGKVFDRPFKDIAFYHGPRDRAWVVLAVQSPNDRNRWIGIKALVDTGSPITIFQKRTRNLLGCNETLGESIALFRDVEFGYHKSEVVSNPAAHNIDLVGTNLLWHFSVLFARRDGRLDLLEETPGVHGWVDRTWASCCAVLCSVAGFAVGYLCATKCAGRKAAKQKRK